MGHWLSEDPLARPTPSVPVVVVIPNAIFKGGLYETPWVGVTSEVFFSNAPSNLESDLFRTQ